MKKIIKICLVISLLTLLNGVLTSCGGSDSGSKSSPNGGGEIVTPDINDGGIELGGDTKTSLEPLILLRFPKEMNPSTINPDTVTLVDQHGNVFGIDQLVASDGNTVFTIILSGPLDPNTKYTIKVSDKVQYSDGKYFPGQNLEFTTGNINVPSVSIQSPTNHQVGVNLNPLIQITFSEEVLNLNTNTVKVHLGSEEGPEVAIDSILKNTGNAYSIAFTNQLAENTTYYIVFSNEITNTYNIKMKKTVFSFTTGDYTAPTSTLISPENNGNNIPTTPSIGLRFNESVTNVTTSTLTLHESSADGALVAVNQILHTDNNTYTLVIDHKLKDNTTYHIVLSDQITDMSNNHLVPITYLFKTGSYNIPEVGAIEPADGQTEVSTTPMIDFIFSESVTNVNTSTVELRQDSATGEQIAISDIVKNPDGTYSFTPDSPLQDNTTYYVIFTDGIVDGDGNAMEEHIISFTTGDEHVPTVMMISPGDNAENVSTTPSIAVKFSEVVTNVNPTTVTLHEDSISGTSVAIDQIIKTENNTYTVQLNGMLKDSKTYYLVLSDQIKDLADKSLVVTTYSFKTGNHNAPEIEAIEPSNGQTEVTTTPNIDFSFSEDVTNVTKDTVELRKDSSSGDLVAITDIVQSPDGTYSFTPSAPLEDNTTYYVVFTDKIVDANGNHMEERIISFTTGDEHVPTVEVLNPADNATDVVSMPLVSIKFSEKVQHVSTQSVKLYYADYNIPANQVAITEPLLSSNNTYTFTPVDALLEGNNYYIVIEDSITDLANKPLASSIVTSFHVSDISQPTVVMLTPSNNATDISRSPMISFRFNESVNNVNTTNVTLHTGSISGSTVTISQILSIGDNIYQVYLANGTPLAMNTTYYLVFNNNISDDAGNKLAATNYHFTTGSISRPTIGQIQPASNSTNVSDIPLISFVLSGNSQNVSNQTVKLHENSIDGNLITTREWQTEDLGNGYTRYSFTPRRAGLADFTTYYVVLSDEITDANGNSMEVTSFSFTTGNNKAPTVEMISPLPDATGVSLMPTIQIQFNEHVHNVTESTVALYIDPNPSVSFLIPQNKLAVTNVTYLGNNIYSFTPAVTLQANKQYQVIIWKSGDTLTGAPEVGVYDDVGITMEYTVQQGFRTGL